MSFLPHADILEIIWFLVIFFGATIKMAITLSVCLEYRQTKSDPRAKKVDIYMVRSVLFHNAHMFTIFLLLVAAAAWTLKNAPPPPRLQDTQSFGNVLIMLGVSVLLTMHAFMVAWWWRKLTIGNFNGTHHHVSTRAASTETTINVPVTVKTEVVPKDEDYD